MRGQTKRIQRSKETSLLFPPLSQIYLSPFPSQSRTPQDRTGGIPSAKHSTPLRMLQPLHWNQHLAVVFPAFFTRSSPGSSAPIPSFPLGRLDACPAAAWETPRGCTHHADVLPLPFYFSSPKRFCAVTGLSRLLTPRCRGEERKRTK